MINVVVFIPDTGIPRNHVKETFYNRQGIWAWDEIIAVDAEIPHYGKGVALLMPQRGRAPDTYDLGLLAKRMVQRFNAPIIIAVQEGGRARNEANFISINLYDNGDPV